MTPECDLHCPPRQRKPFPEGSIPLSKAALGQWHTVVNTGGEDALRRRLLDMGFTPKTRVLPRKTAPLGDPLELHLRGYDLSLRLSDAANILVLPLPGENPADDASKGVHV